MSRRFLIIGIIVLSALIGLLLIYNFVLKGKLPKKEPLPETKKEFQPSIQPISRQTVVSPTLDSSGAKIKFYLKESGNVMESDFDGGNQKIISSAKIQGLARILWSPAKDKVISFYENGDKYFYDYNTKKSTKLNFNIKDVIWTGDKIIYQFKDAARNSFNVSNPDGSAWRPLTFHTENRIFKMDWVSGKLYFYLAPSGYVPSSLNVLDDKGISKTIFSRVNGLGAKWAPNGEKFIFSGTDFQGKRLSLSLSDKDGLSIKNLNLAALAEKCVWSGDNKNIFCAAPKEVPQFAVMPDAYYGATFRSVDYFIRINTDTLEKNWLINPNLAGDYDASDLFLSPDENYLFFVNRIGGLLYSLQMRQ